MPQEGVIAVAVQTGLPATVGPTSAKGWTAIWSPAQEALSSGLAVRYLAIDEIDEDLDLHVFPGTGEVLRQTWSAHGALVRSTDRAGAMAAALSLMFEGLDRQDVLEAVLNEGQLNTEDLLGALGSLLDLPELDDPIPTMAVVAFRGNYGDACVAATAAGPAYVSAASGGWAVLVASGEDDFRSMGLAAGLSRVARRSDAVFLLWRDGAASGWQLWRRGKQIADGSWNARWRVVEPDPLKVEVENVRGIVKAMGESVDQSALRALLRGSHQELDPLAELVAILNLPAQVLQALGGGQRPSELAGFELIEMKSARQVALEAWRGGFGEAERTAVVEQKVTSALSIPFAIGTVVAAIASVAMTALSVGTLMTDGALVEQAGTSGEDWAFLVLTVLLSVVLVRAAVSRVRRVRSRPGAG